MSWVYYGLAAVAEIAGCFAFWAWLKLDRSPLWLIPGMASLALFAFLLTRVESEAAGRAYASYGGVYILASIIWLWLVEQNAPDRWDVIGTAVCLAGAGIILLGPRSASLAGSQVAPHDRTSRGGRPRRRLSRQAVGRSPWRPLALLCMAMAAYAAVVFDLATWWTGA